MKSITDLSPYGCYARYLKFEVKFYLKFLRVRSCFCYDTRTIDKSNLGQAFSIQGSFVLVLK